MDVMEAIRTRRSVRDYDTRPIPEDVLDRMKSALRLAPSACNFQPWRFVIVMDAHLRQKVAETAKGQTFVAKAPVIVIGVGFPNAAYKRMGGYDNSVEVDVAIALDHLTLAAAGEGLGTCWIGAFDESALKKVINAPKDSKIVAFMPMGYPARPDLLHPMPEDRRRREAEVFIDERFE